MLDEVQKAFFFLKAWQCCQKRNGNYQKQEESSISEKFQLELVFAWGQLSVAGGLAKCRGQELKLEA